MCNVTTEKNRTETVGNVSDCRNLTIKVWKCG